jgi:flagellin-specific chaperone FliS
LEQFEKQEISAEFFADAFQRITTHRNSSLEDSVKELLSQAAVGEKRQNIQDARDKIGELIIAMEGEGGGRISVEDVFILKRYLNAQIVKGLKINSRKLADVHSEIIKIARRLFLA